MSLYVIMFRTDSHYQLVERLLIDHPDLKKGFTLKQILKIPSLSLDNRKIIKNMFGGAYSDVLTPEMDFEYRNGKWEVEEIDRQRGSHQFITKVLNHALKEGKYPLGSYVSTSNDELMEFLVRKQQEVFESEIEDSEGCGFTITQEMLDFLCKSLGEKLGEMSRFDYGLVRDFLYSLHDFEEMLTMREFR